MQNSLYRLPIALGAYGIWVTITVVGLTYLNPGMTTLYETISHGPAWNIIAAALFLVLLAWICRWRDLGFNRVDPVRSWLLLWLPGLFIASFFVLATLSGLPAPAQMAWIGFNTLFVGLSEELMFRGILYRGLRSRVALWPAILLVSLLFGSVHVLNVFLTGELLASGLQAIAAFMSGLLFIAILLRTRSILPVILFHWLWDFGIFAMSGSPATALAKAPDPEEASNLTLFLPLILVLPNFLYALFLLRKLPAAAPGEGA